MSSEKYNIATRKVYAIQLCIHMFVATDQCDLKKGNSSVNRIVKSMNYGKCVVSTKVLM